MSGRNFAPRQLRIRLKFLISASGKGCPLGAMQTQIRTTRFKSHVRTNMYCLSAWSSKSREKNPLVFTHRTTYLRTRGYTVWVITAYKNKPRLQKFKKKKKTPDKETIRKQRNKRILTKVSDLLQDEPLSESGLGPKTRTKLAPLFPQ